MDIRWNIGCDKFAFLACERVMWLGARFRHGIKPISNSFNIKINEKCSESVNNVK